jgi:hypothetical protein
MNFIAPIEYIVIHSKARQSMPTRSIDPVEIFPALPRFENRLPLDFFSRK